MIVDLLYTDDVAGMNELPSPNQLRNKIIIKAKKFISPPNDNGTANQEDEEQSPDNGGADNESPVNVDLPKVVNNVPLDLCNDYIKIGFSDWLFRATS